MENKDKKTLGRKPLSELEKEIRGTLQKVQLNMFQSEQLDDYSFKAGLPADVVIKNAIDHYFEYLVTSGEYVPSFFATREAVQLRMEQLIFKHKMGREMTEEEVGEYHKRVAEGRLTSKAE